VRSENELEGTDRLGTNPTLTHREPRSYSLELRITESKPQKIRSEENSPKTKVNLTIPALTERDARDSCFNKENFKPHRPAGPKPEARHPRQVSYVRRYLKPKTIQVFPEKPPLLPASSLLPAIENE
jgi:hypothetical protein